jgi:hypothetical protein
MPKQNKKILSALKQEIDRITRIFLEINNLNIQGETQTEKEYIWKAFEMMTFILRRNIHEKIGENTLSQGTKKELQKEIKFE